MWTIIAGILLGAILGAILVGKTAGDWLAMLKQQDPDSFIFEANRVKGFVAFGGGLFGAIAGGFGVAAFF
jgi:hypothetical protein